MQLFVLNNIFGAFLRRFFTIIFFLLSFLYASSKPDLMLLYEYKDQNISGYLMSEKLDGIRAFWDGSKLISRNGKVFNAPIWFIKDFPKFELDGELYTKQNDFENILSIVSKKTSNESWKEIRFHIFDAPTQNGGLLKRLEFAKNNTNSTYIKIIEQFVCKDEKELKEFLAKVELEGGEGVVLREPNISYIAKRTDYNLKVKSLHDKDCVVTQIHKNIENNQISSFTCKLENNETIKIGSGLNDELRNSEKLQIGDIVSFKHNGFTNSNKPKFPVFLKIKDKL